MRFAPTLPIAPLVSSLTRVEDQRVAAIGAASAMTPLGPGDPDQTECDGALPADLLRPSIFETLAKAGARLDDAAHGRRGGLLGLCVVVSAFGHLFEAPRLERAGIVLFWSAATVFATARFAVTPDGRGWNAATLWKELEAPLAQARSTLEACAKSWARPLPRDADLDRIQSTAALLKMIGVTGYPVAHVLGSGVPMLALALCLGCVGKWWCAWKRPPLRSNAARCFARPARAIIIGGPGPTIAIPPYVRRTALTDSSRWGCVPQPMDYDAQRALTMPADDGATCAAVANTRHT